MLNLGRLPFPGRELSRGGGLLFSPMKKPQLKVRIVHYLAFHRLATQFELAVALGATRAAIKASVKSLVTSKLLEITISGINGHRAAVYKLSLNSSLD